MNKVAHLSLAVPSVSVAADEVGHKVAPLAVVGRIVGHGRVVDIGVDDVLRNEGEFGEYRAVPSSRVEMPLVSAIPHHRLRNVECALKDMNETQK